LIDISKEYEGCLEIISKTRTSFESIKEFYHIKEQASKYFDVTVDINALQFALSMLSHP
jgi:hypothetical protein